MSTLGLYPSNTYEPTVQADLAMTFMKDNKNHPFFCMVSWGPPHTPYGDHPAEYQYNAADVVPRLNVPDAYLSAAKGTLDDYFAHCNAIDHEIGRLMDFLDKEGLTDNTLVIFSADHGDMHRSHAMTYKGKPEEESWHVPLLMRLPGEIKPGKIVDNPISSADLMPTILSVCGLNAPATCTGRDKSAAMTEAGMADESIYGGVKDTWRAVVKGDYKLVVEVVDGNQVVSKMFDLKDDPYEMENRAFNSDYDSIKTDLLAEIEMWKLRTQDSFPVAPWMAQTSY